MFFQVESPIFLTPAPQLGAQVHFFKFCSLFREHQLYLPDFVILGQPMRGAYDHGLLSVLFFKGQKEIVAFSILPKKRTKNFCPSTLESGIEVGPTVINLAFFSRPYGLIRDYIKVI